jgi:predicted nucleic acid-binding protein
MKVPDASAIGPAIAGAGPDGDQARAVLSNETGFMPYHADVEAASLLRRLWLRGAITEPELSAHLSRLARLPFQRLDPRPFFGRMYELRATVTMQDAAYVAIAEYLDCELVTADARLARAPGPRCKFIVLGG